jgi:capsular polysaccharide biosynthesis protein
VDPRIAVRAMVVAVVLVAVGVVAASLLQTPTYEASAQVWVDERSPAQGAGNGKIQLIPNAPAGETLRALTQTTMMAIETRTVAEEAIQRLGLEMAPAELLDNLTVEPVEDTSFIVLTYQGTDPVEATQIVNTLGEVSSELISERSAAGSKLTAKLYGKAQVPDGPVSPDPLRNGLLTLVMGWGLIGLLVLIHRRSWKTNSPKSGCRIPHSPVPVA